MLHDILIGQEKSNFILITDEAESCGRSLLLNLALELLKRHTSIVIACLERQPQFFKSWLPSDGLHKIKWLESASYLPCQQNDVLNNLSKMVEKSDDQTVVVIDSLSTPLFLHDAPLVCQALHKLKGANNVCQVVALLHRDVHDENTQRLIKHQASTVLDLSPGPHGCQACHIRHSRPTGKVIKSTEAFGVDAEFHVQNIRPLNKIDDSKLKKNNQPDQADPTSQLTFNLSLTSSEKEARSHLVLPYLKDRSTEEPMTQGRIHYQADEMDDLDEEDPDDDLNI